MTRPTEKQITARVRNFKIWRLRGLWAQQFLLTSERIKAAQVIVDTELELLGAEPETTRRERLRIEQRLKEFEA